MLRDKAILQSIESERRVTGAQDGAFLYAVQEAVLLALQEAGVLTELQLRIAVGNLRKQHRTMTVR